MRKFLLFLPLVFITYFLVPTSAYAVCPVCTVAVVAGLGLSRWIGIDDTISGIWIGGLILSLAFWLTDWMKKKNINIAYFTIIAVFLTYILVFIPLQIAGITGHPLNKLWGIDKLFLGSIMGSAAFLVGIIADKIQRKIKGGQLFPFQKVVFPVLSLVIISIIFALITKSH